jgi:hypothetical protein
MFALSECAVQWGWLGSVSTFLRSKLIVLPIIPPFIVTGRRYGANAGSA